MLNPRLVVSASIAGNNNGLSLPGPVNLTGSSYGPGGSDGFDVSAQNAFSLQAYVTGSSVNGVLALQQSNNLAGWFSIMSQSIAGASVSQDYLFQVQYNAAGFARLLWSGSAGTSSSISIASAGNK